MSGSGGIPFEDGKGGIDAVEKTSLLEGRVVLFQPHDGYRTAIDPVLLAAAVPDTGWRTALDVGTGTGAAMLCLAHRQPANTYIGIELQPIHAALAQRSIEENGRTEHVSVHVADVCGALPEPLKTAVFDHVLTNPPFHRPGHRSHNDSRATALTEEVPLDDWLGFCLRRLRPRGGLTVIHRADRLDEILATLHGKAGAVEVIPLWPRQGVAAKRVIVRARKGLKSPLVMHPGLTLHLDDGRYTPQADAVLRAGLSIDAVMGE